jgi:hypothetical protein
VAAAKPVRHPPQRPHPHHLEVDGDDAAMATGSDETETTENQAVAEALMGHIEFDPHCATTSFAAPHGHCQCPPPSLASAWDGTNLYTT